MREYRYMFLAAVCMGTVGVLIKSIGNEIPAMSLNFLRVFLGFIFLLATVPWIDKGFLKASGKELKEYFVSGLLIALSLSAYNIAMRIAPVHNVVLIHYTYPFFVLVFAYFSLKEKLTTTKFFTLSLAVFAFILMNPFKGEANDQGNFLALVGAFFHGLLITWMRRVRQGHNIGSVIWFFFFASLLLSPFPFIFGWGNLNGVLAKIILLGFISTGLSYLLFNLALEKIEAGICSIIAIIITPLVSILLAVAIIGETLNQDILIGGWLLILSGVFLLTSKK